MTRWSAPQQIPDNPNSATDLVDILHNSVLGLVEEHSRCAQFRVHKYNISTAATTQRGDAAPLEGVERRAQNQEVENRIVHVGVVVKRGKVAVGKQKTGVRAVTAPVEIQGAGNESTEIAFRLPGL